MVVIPWWYCKVDEHKDLPEEIHTSNSGGLRHKPLYWLCYPVTDGLAFKHLFLLVFVSLWCVLECFYLIVQNIAILRCGLQSGKNHGSNSPMGEEYWFICRLPDYLFLVAISKFFFSLRLLQKFDFPTMKFSLFFLGYEDKNDIPKDKTERTAWTFSRKATLELTQ